jgi:hypothetical protein
MKEAKIKIVELHKDLLRVLSLLKAGDYEEAEEQLEFIVNEVEIAARIPAK